MVYISIVLVCFLASAAGAICGIGGGVIIKPVLDAAGIMSVAAVSFLSGCTVLSMSVVSMWRSKRAGYEFAFDRMLATVLASGAALGGLAGKELFQRVTEGLPNRDQVGAVQAFVLMLVTAGTLLYTIFQERIQGKKLKNKPLAFGIGAVLGVMSSFLGIGGGPINLVVLFYFFSMTAKEAAVYSIDIIMFSQTASLLAALVKGNVPPFEPVILGIMIACGVLGGLAGSRVNRKIDNSMTQRLFMGMMGVIICINIYNIFRYI